MGETFSKKERAKQKNKKKQEKAEKREERKANNQKGGSLEDMMAYLDEDGNLTSKPPVNTVRKKINVDEILLGAKPIEEEEKERTGIVAFFNVEKSYGFITDSKTQENIFVHAKNLLQPIGEKDKVLYEREKGERGFQAVNVKKV